MKSFVYDGLPVRVVFGAGAVAKLPDEVDRAGLSRVVVICTSGRRNQVEQIEASLGSRVIGVLDQAAMHVSVTLQQQAVEQVRRLTADGGVTLGGGSTTGLAKAIALETEFPVVAVPTTYAGSEMTPIWGLTDGGVKRTGRDRRVLPRTVIYDPRLSLTLPPRIAGPSGFNAIAHCVEAFYAEDANPITSLMAEEGIRVLAKSLPNIAKHPDDLETRSLALYGAWLGGVALGSMGMALHHKLSHTLGGAYGLNHADVHTILLPQVAAYNQRAASEALCRVARALDVDSAPVGLYELARSIGARLALKEIGMKASDLDEAADLATQNPYYNPEPITRAGIRKLLDNAYFGRRPS